jgi:hypothetical protein
MAKIAPAVTRLWFKIDKDSTTNFLDLSLACSAANRRFYRQGTNWAVAGMCLHTVPSGASPVAGSFEVSKIPDTWVAHNAHSKAKSLWMESQKQVLDDSPSLSAKYRDFKIYLDKDMVGATIWNSNDPASDGSILIPVASNGNITKIGEWVYSTIQLPVDGGSAAPTEITMHMVGGDTTTPNQSRGLIHGYGLSRSRPQEVDPNTPTDGGWMNDVFDDADTLEEIRTDVTENNDRPPYRVGGDTGDTEEYYPGGKNNAASLALHSKNYITSTTIGGKTNAEGGMFGCGLLRFDWELYNHDTLYLSVDLVPGNYKGYLTEVY